MKQFWMHLMVDDDILDCESVLMEFMSTKMSFQVSPLQASNHYTCGWLITGCHVQTFNYNHFTKLIQVHPKFKNIPICCKKRPINLVTAITIDCSSNKLAY